MKIRYPLTIVSDLHVGHSASYVSTPEKVAPLIADSASVVFNGDTVEMLWVHNRPKAREQLRKMASVCRREGARPVFVNGNHDPFISTVNHVDLCDGSILVTHGDILFHEVAPWSRYARILGPRRSRFLSRIADDDGLAEFEKQLLASKWASLSLEMREPCSPNGYFARARMVAREGWPPWRALRIVKYWMETPVRAAGLARVFRPRVRFTIIGHTHRAGVWRVGPRIVINTGSFLPMSRRIVVRIDEGGERLVLRRVERSGGLFRPGSIIAEHSIRPLEPEEAAAT